MESESDGDWAVKKGRSHIATFSDTPLELQALLNGHKMDNNIIEFKFSKEKGFIIVSIRFTTGTHQVDSLVVFCCLLPVTRLGAAVKPKSSVVLSICKNDVNSVNTILFWS